MPLPITDSAMGARTELTNYAQNASEIQ